VYQRHRLLLWRRKETVVYFDELAELLYPPLAERRLEEFEYARVVYLGFRRSGSCPSRYLGRLRNSITLLF
jgi:hypothetical protein